MSLTTGGGCIHPACTRYSDSAVTVCDDCDDLQSGLATSCSYCGQNGLEIDSL